MCSPKMYSCSITYQSSAATPQRVLPSMTPFWPRLEGAGSWTLGRSSVSVPARSRSSGLAHPRLAKAFGSATSLLSRRVVQLCVSSLVPRPDLARQVLHEPRLWPEYHPNYYGTFVRDPDGNNVEAVCHMPE